MTSTDLSIMPPGSKPPTERRSILVTMAGKYGMEAGAFEQTLRATVFPANASREHFAAFLVVANEYGLNPLTREIYAFPAKGGGITPIVSIDGWLNIINSHPMMNGIEFDDQIDDHNNMTAITARIWRKDRDKPITVTEYMAECHRGTDPWKNYPCRMLRHKALIQCARYAFGFAGIVDPDEAERIADARDVTSTKGYSTITHKPPSGAQQYEQFAGNVRRTTTTDEPAESQDAGPAGAHIGAQSADGLPVPAPGETRETK